VAGTRGGEGGRSGTEEGRAGRRAGQDRPGTWMDVFFFLTPSTRYQVSDGEAGQHSAPILPQNFNHDEIDSVRAL
jgi:hypothetical protein